MPVIASPTRTHDLEIRFRELQEQLVKAERQSQRFRTGPIRRYLEIKIREIEAELSLLGR
jgi:hypothetical protein